MNKRAEPQAQTGRGSTPDRRLALLGLLATVLSVYLIWARPLQQRWGATDEEVARSMPGDELDAHPDSHATRAMTIRGTPEQIWPWLAQMGYGRAGLYGFDIVRGPGGARSAERILPQFQDIPAGDSVSADPVTPMKFHAVESPRYIVWSGDDGHRSFTWALYPVDAENTRLVSRVRWDSQLGQPALFGSELLNEFTQNLAVREMLQGIQGRVEGHIRPASDSNIEAFIYAGTLVAFVWAAISLLRLPLTWGSWLVGLAGGLTWLVSWYAPVSIWVGAVSALLVVWAVRVEFRDHQRAKLAQPARTKAAPSRGH